MRGRSKKHQTQPKKLTGSVQKNRRGFGFIVFDNRVFEDLYLDSEKAKRFFLGDRVAVITAGRGDIQSIDIIARRSYEIVGRYLPYPKTPAGGMGGAVVFEVKNAREEIHCPHPPKGLLVGTWVRVKLEFPEKGPYTALGEIVEIYGTDLPASADIAMIAGEHGLIEKHSAEAIQEAEDFELNVDWALSHGWKDLREIPFITIDGEDARDFDDAVFVDRNRDGFELWVAIADVSHYVRPGTNLDSESYARGTSVYFPERAFHMLPSALSENLCSLRPNEPRLTIGVKIKYDSRGKKISHEPFEAVIESRRRATYTQIEAERKSFPNHFALYSLLRQKKTDRGAIDFDLPEPKVICDPNGEPKDVVNRERLDSHRLIEEFMIAANEAVTEWMVAKRRPFLYRVHATPSRESLEKLSRFMKNFGVTPHAKILEPTPMILADLAREIEEHPAAAFLQSSMLRAMKQAVYSNVHDIHFGLASEAYTHFTSPIRRYPDLVVHRLIRAELRHERNTDTEAQLNEVGIHTSFRERLAADAERASVKLKQVRIANKHLGDEFEGKVGGFAERGIFIQIDKPYVEGMIPKEGLLGELFEFVEEEMIYLARKSGRTIRVGDEVTVQIVRTSIELRQVELKLNEHRAQNLRPGVQSKGPTQHARQKKSRQNRQR